MCVYAFRNIYVCVFVYTQYAYTYMCVAFLSSWLQCSVLRLIMEARQTNGTNGQCSVNRVGESPGTWPPEGQSSTPIDDVWKCLNATESETKKCEMYKKKCQGRSLIALLWRKTLLFYSHWSNRILNDIQPMQFKWVYWLGRCFASTRYEPLSHKALLKHLRQDSLWHLVVI